MILLLAINQLTETELMLSPDEFHDMGFDQVVIASGVQEAMHILQTQPVDVLLAELALSGENGMDLIEHTTAHSPHTICIPLDSEVNFEHIKTSFRLECLDYLVKPFSRGDLKDCLIRACQRKRTKLRDAQARILGETVRRNEISFTGNMVHMLYSPDQEAVSESLRYLNACGYVVNPDTPARLCVVVDLPYIRHQRPVFSHDRMIAAIRDSFMMAPEHPVPLITRNPYRQFLVLLVPADGVSSAPCTEATLQYALNEMTRRFQTEPSIYVRPEMTLNRIQGEPTLIQELTANNVAEKTGIIYAERLTHFQSVFLSGRELLPRWKALLQQDKYMILLHELEAYLDRFGNENLSLRLLSDLHLQWSRIIFENLGSRNIDVMDLFSSEYSYATYMDCFHTLQGLKRGFTYLLNAAANIRKISLDPGDVARAKSYIRAHLNEPILVSQVADHINLTSEYFTRQFKKETGLSLKDFIIQEKIKSAKDLLTRTSMPVSQIAQELGYDNFSHFTQIFRKSIGCTPSEYRKQHLSSHAEASQH